MFLASQFEAKSTAAAYEMNSHLHFSIGFVFNSTHTIASTIFLSRSLLFGAAQQATSPL